MVASLERGGGDHDAAVQWAGGWVGAGVGGVVGEKLQIRGGRGGLAVGTVVVLGCTGGVIVVGKVNKLLTWITLLLLITIITVTAASVGFFPRLLDMDRMFGFLYNSYFRREERFSKKLSKHAMYACMVGTLLT